MTEYLVCPFCKEDDFDLIGLKTHLWCNHCEVFNKTEVDTTTMADLLHLKKEENMKSNIGIARVCHEANRQYCIDNQLKTQAEWDELPDDLQNSVVAGVAKIINDPQITAEEMHEAWMEYKAEEGWIYGDEVDVPGKEHPNMLKWKKLSKVERGKDKLFLATVKREMKA